MDEQRWWWYTRLGRRRRSRPKRGFRLGSTRRLIPLLRFRLRALFDLLRRWFKEVRRGIGGGDGSRRRWSGARSGTSGRWLATEVRRRGGQVELKNNSCARSNSFYAEAIADCLEFIKRSTTAAVGDEV